MPPKHSAARPRRDGENFARTHHNEASDVDPKRVKFDVRNPSTLAAEAREDDAILDADVIGRSGATKRGAVNVDGYDSDSDNETFNARAQQRRKGKVDILDQLDNYNASGEGPQGQAGTAKDDDDEEDMFAASDDEEKPKRGPEDDEDPEEFDASGKKRKHVEFLDTKDIVGEVGDSKTGGHVHLDKEESSDDEADVELAVQEEGIDEEVGAGGLKRNAPKLEAFHLREEMEEGNFDQQGNYIRRAGDPDAVHDNWLEGMGKKEIRKAAEAHQKREAEARQQRMDEDSVLVSDLLKSLILQLEKAETPMEALARLGKSQTKSKKKIPAWKLKKMKDAGNMDVDQAEDPEQLRIKEAIQAVTEAADRLLSRDYEEIYDQEREMLIREWRKETGEDWVEPSQSSGGAANGDRKWEFRWTDGRDGGQVQGPYDGPTMKAWQDAGYFGEGIEFRSSEPGAEWTRAATFD